VWSAAWGVACDASASGGRTPNLVVAGEPGTAIETADYAEPDRPYSWTSFELCLDRPGRVVIEKAEIAVMVGELRIEAFGVKPLLRDQPGMGSTLQDLGHPAQPSTTVDAVSKGYGFMIYATRLPPWRLRLGRTPAS
jgi:hypothetical protein